MKKILYLLLAFPTILFAQQGNYTVKGKVGQLNSHAKVYLRYESGYESVIDSCVLKNGEFAISGKLDGEKEAIFMIDYNGKGLNDYKYTSHVMRLYLENGTIFVNSKDSLNHVVISGSPVNDESKRYNNLMLQETTMLDHVADLERKMIISKKIDTPLMTKLDHQMDSLNVIRYAVMREYIKKNPDSYFSLASIKEMDPYADPTVSLPLFNTLSKRLQRTAIGRDFKQNLDKGLLVSIGHLAPDFTENDIHGKPVSLSSFRGKYVLLDFWASWCAPCRAETPNVVKLYNRFKDRNFTVLSVSLDGPGDKKRWMDAIEKDGMPWTNISALMFFKGPGATLYNLLAIPSNVLIDPSGKIIARNLMGKELEHQLEESLH
jgi:peroxiredoxin